MNNIERIKIIVRNLESSEKLRSYNKEGENAPGTTAHALLDMEDSFILIREYISKLEVDNIGEDIVNEILFDIGEELRHILYHINDVRFYDYLGSNK